MTKRKDPKEFKKRGRPATGRSPDRCVIWCAGLTQEQVSRILSTLSPEERGAALLDATRSKP